MSNGLSRIKLHIGDGNISTRLRFQVGDLDPSIVVFCFVLNGLGAGHSDESPLLDRHRAFVVLVKVFCNGPDLENSTVFEYNEIVGLFELIDSLFLLRIRQQADGFRQLSSFRRRWSARRTSWWRNGELETVDVCDGVEVGWKRVVLDGTLEQNARV